MKSRIVRRDEDGASLIMAMIVMMVLSTLSLAILGRTLTVMTYVRHGQDYDAALAAAEAGLADALFKIDQNAPPSWKATGATGVNGVAGAGTYQYWAVKQSESRYVVTAMGQVGKAKHGIEMLVTRNSQFPYALFSQEQLHFNGTTAGPAKVNFYSFNGVVGQPDEVRVGSNTTVVCNGTPDPNVFIDWYGPTASDCESTRVAKLAKKRDMTFKDPPAVNQGCPAGGVFGSAGSTALTPVLINGMGGVPFVCSQDVTFVGFVNATNGPVKIYIVPDSSGTHHALNLAGAVINATGSATQMQIFKRGNVPMTFNGNTSSNLTFRGVLFAPETTMRWNGGIWWAGSINVGQLTVNGAPNLKIGYDFDLNNYLGPDWRVSRYHEIPSAGAPVVIP
jgi:hypothetical protein